MLRLHRILCVLIFFTVIAYLSIGLVRSDLLDVYSIYSNIYLLLFKLLAFSLIAVENRNEIDLQLFRYKTMKSFVSKKIVIFTLSNSLFVTGMGLIEFLIMTFRGIDVEYRVILTSSVYLFLIFEIVYLNMFRDLLAGKSMLISYGYLLILFLMFVICVVNEFKSLTPLNLFRDYFNIGFSIESFLVYLVYFSVSLITLLTKARKVEI